MRKLKIDGTSIKILFFIKVRLTRLNFRNLHRVVKKRVYSLSLHRIFLIKLNHLKLVVNLYDGYICFKLSLISFFKGTQIAKDYIFIKFLIIFIIETCVFADCPQNENEVCIFENSAGYGICTCKEGQEIKDNQIVCRGIICILFLMFINNLQFVETAFGWENLI